MDWLEIFMFTKTCVVIAMCCAVFYIVWDLNKKVADLQIRMKDVEYEKKNK